MGVGAGLEGGYRGGILSIQEEGGVLCAGLGWAAELASVKEMGRRGWIWDGPDWGEP